MHDHFYGKSFTISLKRLDILNDTKIIMLNFICPFFSRNHYNYNWFKIEHGMELAIMNNA